MMTRKQFLSVVGLAIGVCPAALAPAQTLDVDPNNDGSTDILITPLDGGPNIPLEDFNGVPGPTSLDVFALLVGAGGDPGAMRIDGAFTLSANWGILGVGGPGHVWLTGLTPTMEFRDFLIVGGAESASLSITGAGALVSVGGADDFYIGGGDLGGAGLEGTVTVGGTATTSTPRRLIVDASDSYIGFDANGTLNVNVNGFASFAGEIAMAITGFPDPSGQFTSGTINMNGGRLVAGDVRSGLGLPTFNFNRGEVVLRDDQALNNDRLAFFGLDSPPSPASAERVFELEGRTTLNAGSITLDQPVMLSLKQALSIPSGGSARTLTLDGEGVGVSVDSGVVVGGSAAGTLRINNGASFTVNAVGGVADSGELAIASGGRVDLNGGVLAARDLAFLAPGGAFNFNAGTLALSQGQFLTADRIEELLGGTSLGPGRTLEFGGISAVSGRLDVDGGTVTDGLLVLADGLVDMTGGRVDSYLDLESGGTLTVTGGSMPFVIAGSGSVVNWLGGTRDDIFVAVENAEVNIVGARFQLDGVPLDGLSVGQPYTITDRDVMLSGTLGDGSPFELDLNSVSLAFQDSVDPEATLTVTLCSGVDIRNTRTGVPYCSIQAAIDMASDGDVIELGAGTIFEDNIVFPAGLDVTVTGAGVDQTIIDGGGAGSPDAPILAVGGAAVSASVSDLTLRNGEGTGGGAVTASGRAQATFTRVAFRSNTGLQGDVFSSGPGTRVALRSCVISGSAGRLSAACEGFATLEAVNCLFYDADLTGVNAALGVLGNGSISVVNTTIDHADGTALLNLQSSIPIHAENCVLIGTLSSFINISHSLYAGAPATDGNIDGVPTFVDAAGGDYRLAPGSLGIDAADYDAYLDAGGGSVDLGGDPRLRDDPGTPNTGIGAEAFLDVGAFEFQGTTGDQPCNAADLAEPFGVLDLSDINTFVAAFLRGETVADLNGDDVIDLGDINLFTGAFVAGCP